MPKITKQRGKRLYLIRACLGLLFSTMDSTTASPSSVEQKSQKNSSERDTATPSPHQFIPLMQKSSSSSSLLLPENKKDSPTKSSRLNRSRSSGSLQKSPRLSSRSSTPVVMEAPTATESSAAQDAATILDSLKVAEEEIQAQQREAASLSPKNHPPMKNFSRDTLPDATPQRQQVPII